MKRTLSLFTLLVAIVMGAWATDETISWSGSSLTGTGGTNVTAGTAAAVDGSTYKAGTISISSSKIQTESKKHTTDSYWEDFSSGTQGETSTNATTTARIEFPITVGEGYSFNVSEVDFKLEQGGGGGPAVHVFLVQGTTSTWIGYTANATKAYTGLNIVLSSGSAKLVFVLGVASNLNNGRQFKLSGIAIKGTSASAGPVDPVFELSANELEIGKTISVTGPEGLSFNATAVDGTVGAVSVDGGTITGVTAGAAQVRVTSAATSQYNAYDNTFDITVIAAKIETELSFVTPTTTVARGEEVTNAATLTAGGETVSGTITYSSDNEAVATVDATGKVTGVTVGTANIKANFAGDATYSAAEEVSYAITVTLPALTPVSSKLWTVKDAALLAEYPVNSSTKTKDITATNVIDNMEIVATSSKKMTMAYNASAATHEDLPEGLTYRFQTLGVPGSDNDARYLHFKAAANSKVSAYFIRGTEGVNVAGYSLGTLDSGNPTGICANTGGDTGKMVFATGDTETDVYLYSASEASSRGVQYIAVKVEPAVATNVTLNSKGYATYSSDCDFTFEGADAYGMNLTETSLVGTKVTTGKIAAGEGILFKGNADATVTITLTSGAASLEGNSLKGSTQADGRLAAKPSFCYTLSGDTFMYYIGENLVANKAFFATDSNLGNNLELVFDEGEATAVEAIAEAEADAATPVKVIKNGKLYIGNYNVAGARIK